jgi:hypothetical protein
MNSHSFFISGITTFLIIRMWFGKAVLDFNASIVAQGQQGPKLIASIGNAFTSESDSKRVSEMKLILPRQWCGLAMHFSLCLSLPHLRNLTLWLRNNK